MTVKTVGEMVHGHTFMPFPASVRKGPIDAESPCYTVVDVMESKYPNEVYCGRPYNEHAYRTALSIDVLDKSPASINRFGFWDAHKFGCASVVEVLGICNCGYTGHNLGHLVFLMQKQLEAYEDYLRPGNWLPSEQMESSKFRTVYASLVKPTEVTANGHPIGTWTPTKQEDPSLA